jgi:hypothetical protein
VPMPGGRMGGGAGVPGPQPAKSEVRVYDVADLLQGVDDKDRKAQVDQLVQVVKIGLGPEANMGTFGTKIIVSATVSGHFAIEAILKALRGGPAPTTAPAKVGQMSAEDMTVDDIAQVDRQMASYLQLRDEIKFQIEQAKLSGAGPNAVKTKMLADALKLREQSIGERAEWFRKKFKDFRFAPDLGMERPATPQEQ